MLLDPFFQRHQSEVLFVAGNLCLSDDLAFRVIWIEGLDNEVIGLFLLRGLCDGDEFHFSSPIVLRLSIGSGSADVSVGFLGFVFIAEYVLLSRLGLVSMFRLLQIVAPT